MFLEGEKTITNLQKEEFFKQNLPASFHSRFDPYAVMKIDKLHFLQTEVGTVLKNLPLGKPKGPDGLGNLPLKRTARPLSVSLKLVFNTITNKHRFPAEWKTSNIIPLYKVGDKQCVSKYRLNSLLACVSKVLESLIFDKLYSAVGSVIRPAQLCFTKQKRTVTQMVLYLSSPFDNLDADTLATIYLDLKKPLVYFTT